MLSRINSTRLASSISVAALTVGLSFGQQLAQKAVAQTVLQGSGSTAAAPFYQAVFGEYTAEVDPNVQVNYNPADRPTGSGAGVSLFLAAQVLNFGATDAPLTEAQRALYPSQFGAPVQVPTVALGVAFAYNPDNLGLPEEQGLVLSRGTYCAIVAGEITNFNDGRISEDNGGVQLNDVPITFVRRSDSSGTTNIFTNHLNTACEGTPTPFTAGVGNLVNFPVGVGAAGSGGVVSQVQSTAGAIGYVEPANAAQGGLPVATLVNQAGNQVAPTSESISSAFAGIEIPEDFAISVPDPGQEGAYPIVGLTYVLLYGQGNEATADPLRAVFNYLYDNGDGRALELGLAPLPQDLKDRAKAAVNAIDTTPDDGGQDGGQQGGGQGQ